MDMDPAFLRVGDFALYWYGAYTFGLLGTLVWFLVRRARMGLSWPDVFGLRTLVDFLRDYESTMWGLPPGQVFNLAMAGAGLAVLLWVRLCPLPAPRLVRSAGASPGVLRVVLFCVLALYPLGIPTSRTRANIEEMRSGPAPAETPAPGG